MRTDPTDGVCATYTRFMDVGPMATMAPRGEVGKSLLCLVSDLPSDAHTWALVALEMLLHQLGHRVINLGPCPTENLILQTCRNVSPDLVAFSTTNGHGLIVAPDLIKRIRSDPDLSDLHVVIGGKLGCGEGSAAAVAVLLNAGFDHAFDEGEGWDSFVAVVDRLYLSRRTSFGLATSA